MKYLITGANGFVGTALCTELARRNIFVRGAIRQPLRSPQELPCETVSVGGIGPDTDWSKALQGIDVVVHLAARVHVMQENAADPLAAFREVNVAGTERLARAAAHSSVRRLVFVSSIKVNGEQTNGVPFTGMDTPAPQDPYGVSKYEAEQVLHRVAQETGMEVVIVRPPLVYGPGVGGNFLRLLKLVSRGVPLPLASVNNLRSMIYLGNFVDALITCATHQAAAGKTYLVSDGKDLSTSELIRNMARLMDKAGRLISFPTALLQLLGHLTGKSGEVERLIGSLQIDSMPIRQELGWAPLFSMEQGLQETVQWYRTKSDE